MKRRIGVFISLLLLPVISSGSQPHYYSFNEVTLTEGDISIKAKTNSNSELLEAFSIDTSNGKINLTDDIIERVTYPKLNSIELLLMPYELERGVRYYHEVHLTYYGEKTCQSSTGSLAEVWAPKSKMVVVFWGEDYTVRFETAECSIH